MSYIKCLELAGLNIIDSKYFGSYQGDWYATYCDTDNNLKFIHGMYGSCSGCDAFESEFDIFYDYCYHLHDTDSYYNPFHNEFIDKCPECNNIKIQAIEFAKRYIDNSMTPIEALHFAKRNLEWDHDVEEMVNWIHEQIEKFSDSKEVN